MFSAKVKDQQESRFLSKHFYTLFLINSFSQEWEHNNIENLNLFIKLSQRQNNFLKYFENFIPILLVLLQKLTWEAGNERIQPKRV